MLELLYIERNRSHKQVVDFFKEEQIPYKERKIDAIPLTKEEITELFKNMDYDNIDELLKRQANMWEILDPETTSFNEYMTFLANNNQYLKQPILRDRSRNQYFMGCESNGLRMFIQRDKKRKSFNEIQKNAETNAPTN